MDGRIAHRRGAVHKQSKSKEFSQSYVTLLKILLSEYRWPDYKDLAELGGWTILNHPSNSAQVWILVRKPDRSDHNVAYS